MIKKDSMLFRFSLYGFLKNLKFFDPFILLIFRSYGLSFLEIGLLYSIRDLAANILEIPTGVIADAFGRRRAMIVAFLAYIASFIMFYVLDDFVFLSLAMVLFAAGEAFRTGTHKALILEHLILNQISELKVAYYGITRAASQLGSALNALIAAGLVFYSGSYRVMFLASTIPYLLDLINVASYPRILDGKIPGIKRGEIWLRVKITLGDFIKIFRDGNVMRTLLNSASFMGVFESVKDYLQPVLASLALSLAVLGSLPDARREAVVVGITYCGIHLLSSLVSRQAYGISSFFRTLPRAVNGTYLAGVAILFLSGLAAANRLYLIAAACFVILFLLYNLRRPITVGLISDRISPRVMASGLSSEAILTTLISALFAPLLGLLADFLGVGTGISLVGVILLALFFLVRVR